VATSMAASIVTVVVRRWSKPQSWASPADTRGCPLPHRIRRNRIWRVTGRTRHFRYYVVRQHNSMSNSVPITYRWMCYMLLQLFQVACLRHGDMSEISIFCTSCGRRTRPNRTEMITTERTKGAGPRHAGVGIAALGIAGESP
jgi:hypothetical protein